jgi:hypothetical protein
VNFTRFVLELDLLRPPTKPASNHLQNPPKCSHEQLFAQFPVVHSQQVLHAKPKSPFSVLAVCSHSHLTSLCSTHSSSSNTGGIGQPLSLLLKMDPLVSSLSLYDIRGAPGVAADISHIDFPGEVGHLLLCALIIEEWMISDEIR